MRTRPLQPLGSALFELEPKLLKGGHVGDYIGDHYRAYSGGCCWEFRLCSLKDLGFGDLRFRDFRGRVVGGLGIWGFRGLGFGA